MDLQFAGEVVGEDSVEHVQLVSNQGPDRYVIDLVMCFELGEDTLLRSPAFMEGDDVMRAHSLVGDDDLDFVPILNGSERGELDRYPALVPDLLSDLVDGTGLADLGIPFTDHDKLPDVVLHDTGRDRLFLVEAVTSHGPMTPKRIVELEEMPSVCPSAAVYVSAFPDFGELR